MNKPVAWMFRGYLYEEDPSSWTVHEHPNVPVIPLYTQDQLEEARKLGIQQEKAMWELIAIGQEIEAHPVKELTDEEIDKAIEYATMQGYGSSYLEGLSDGFEMARAILRKAQEK